MGAVRLTVRDSSSPSAGVRGFALLDVLMATVILGIIVVGTMQLFTFGQSRIVSLSQGRGAYDLARYEIEKVIADGYVDAIAKTDTSLTVDGVPATRTTTITFVDDPADNTGAQDTTGTQDYKLIKVDVTYGNQTVTLRTLLAP